MKRNILLCSMWMAVSLACSSLALGATDTSEAATAGLTSKKDKGTVSIVSSPDLSDGRLILKVVGYNQGAEPASFGPNNLKITTAAGKPVGLLTLDQLIAQTRGVRPPDVSSTHNPANYGSPTMGSDGAGRPDVSGYTGGSRPMGGGLDSHMSATAGAPRGPDSPEVKAQIEALNAAILQPKMIAPASAGGGQVVTDKLKFGRKDERALHVTVDFNGEQHEFNFAVPAGK